MVTERWPFRRKDASDRVDDWLDDFWSSRWERNYFDEFEESFRKMERRMEKLFKDAMSGKLPSPEKGGPYVYGWSFRMGPDGKPVFQEFGNVSGAIASPSKEKEMLGSREPMIDVNETDTAVNVTAEVPGVKKEDINLEVTEDKLIIDINSEDRKYYKEIQLPSEVDPDYAKASYNNGVLDVELKKIKPKRSGKKIKIK